MYVQLEVNWKFFNKCFPFEKINPKFRVWKESPQVRDRTKQTQRDQEKERIDPPDLGAIVLRVGAARCSDLRSIVYYFIKDHTQIGTTRASWLSVCWLSSPSTLQQLSLPYAKLGSRTCILVDGKNSKRSKLAKLRGCSTSMSLTSIPHRGTWLLVYFYSIFFYFEGVYSNLTSARGARNNFICRVCFWTKEVRKSRSRGAKW